MNDSEQKVMMFIEKGIESASAPRTEGPPSADGFRVVRSLEGLNDSVALPPPSAGFWRQLRAFAGPALLISIGYMDPGNWGTDLQARRAVRYGLLWVVALSPA